MYSRPPTISSAVKPPRRHRGHLLVVPLVLAFLLVACGNGADDADAIQSRWRRVSEPNLHDPFQTLAGEYIGFRPGGLLVVLVHDQSAQVLRTATTGKYALLAAGQITITGKCWQGWQSHDCAETYRYELSADRLAVFDREDDARHVFYERAGAISADLLPGLNPPMPSATPAGE